MHSITISEKRGQRFKESTEGFMRGFGERKRKEEIELKSQILKRKRNVVSSAIWS